VLWRIPVTSRSIPLILLGAIVLFSGTGVAQDRQADQITQQFFEQYVVRTGKIGTESVMAATHLVAERGREIATMRALGFGGPSVVFSFVIEALLIAFVGGLIGCLVVLPLNGLTTGAMNLQTFSHLAFAFKITPELLVKGIIFALVMGFVGGLLPAVRAATQPVAQALREL